MGASNFRDFSTQDSVIDAFHELVGQARRMHGDDPYNGTISTVGSYVVIQNMGVTKKQAHEIELAEFRKIDVGTERFKKWGPCCAVRVIDSDVTGWLFFGWAAS